MNPKYFGLNEKIGQLIKVPADQGRIVAIAVAFSAITHARLPTSPVDNPQSFYAEQVLPSLMESLSDINENIVFASRMALDYGLIFWKLRYYAAFPGDFATDLEYRLRALLDGKAGRGMDINLIWAGGLAVVSDEMNQFMNRYKTEITLIAADLIRLLAPPTLNGTEGDTVNG